LIEVFIARSTWFKSYGRFFPQVKNYPDLLLWLEEDPEALSDVEVWGYEQATYVFKDLEEFLKRGGPAVPEDEVEDESEEEVPKKRKEKDRDRDEKAEKGQKDSGNRRLYHCI
jgi:hypothetical protein